MSLQAGNDITIGSLENRHTWEEGQNRFSRIDQLMSELNAGGNLSLSAGNDLSLVASTAEAKGDVNLSAGNNLVLASEANQTSDDVHQGNKHTIDRTTTQIGATVSGDNVSLSAGNNLQAQASTIEAQGNASLQAGGELQLTTADNEEYHYEKSKSSGTFSSKTTEIEQRDVTAQGTTITAGGNVSLASQGDMTLKGSNIKATDSLAIDTEGQLKLLTATDEHFYRKDEKKSGVMVKMSGNGTNSTTERQNQLEGGDITISAGQGVLLQVGQKEGESLQAELDKLAMQPGMAWVEQVRSMPGVKMEAVQEAYEQWNYSQQSLSPIASSIIAIALAVATGGVGAAALGAAQGTATAAMANAAFSTLVSQATISTINNGGNLGAVLKELGSSASVKQLATSVATAGALQGLDKAMGLSSAAPAASNAASQPTASNLFSWDTFNRVTSHSVVTAGINTTINGSHFADAFKASLLSNIQGEVGKATANWIGDQGIKFDAANNQLAEAGKIAAHGVTSGAIAEITGGKFAAGVAGGAMSELASSWSSQVFSNTEHQVALNKVLGGLAAVAVTGDQNQFDTGAERSETVYRYNYLTHKQITDWLDKYGSAATPEERERLLSAAQQVDKVQLEKALQTAISKDALIAQQDDLMQLIQSADCNPSCKALSQHSLNQLTPIIDGYEELERGNNIPKAVIATISLGIPAFSKVVAPTVGKWVGSATIGERLVGVGISGAANAGTQIYYGEPFSWVTFGASMVTGGATVNMGYWGATTVNAAGSGITSLIEQKSPWIPMMASVAGSSSGYLIGKGEAPLNRWINPEKNNMKWLYSPNTPIVYPYPKNNFPSVAAGSLSATASEVASKNTEYLIKSIKEVK
ncbi:DUF637 domain-containing protein [Aeromonas jandaei]|uniref:DUF637 domain-containing protein n=1 Tax=Aeromonas jandaei TaxID=650 RepID=UPI001C03DF1C|nr:DUF637 domain-containing protein [Aeromonas jandaei]QWL65321.1 DUF637 domain-containing protein [Aeromonas jandaei]